MARSKNRLRVENLAVNRKWKRDAPANFQMSWKHVSPDRIARAEIDSAFRHGLGCVPALRCKYASAAGGTVRHHITQQRRHATPPADLIEEGERCVIAEHPAVVQGGEFKRRRIFPGGAVFPTVMFGSLERRTGGFRKAILEQAMIRGEIGRGFEPPVSETQLYNPPLR